MAYLITITRVSQDFTGVAWVRYDTAFRRKAANMGNRKWSQINPSLYSICFMGRAQEAKRYELCLSTAHGTSLCPLQAEVEPELQLRVKVVASAPKCNHAARPRLQVTCASCGMQANADSNAASTAMFAAAGMLCPILDINKNGRRYRRSEINRSFFHAYD